MAFFSQFRGRRVSFRWLAAVLSFCLAVPYLSVAALARGDEPPVYTAGTLCPHHPAHDEACGYAEAQPGQPCGHVHDENCGGLAWESPLSDQGTPASDEGAEGPEIPGCTHVHDEECGYAPAVEAAPCAFFCEICAAGMKDEATAVTGWSWDSDEYGLEFLEDAKLWGLGLPGVSVGNPVTAEDLAELLPREITAKLADGSEIPLSLAWDYSALPEEGAFAGSVTLKAALPEGYILEEGVPEPAVLLEIGGGEMYEVKSKYVNQWSFVEREGTKLSRTLETYEGFPEYPENYKDYRLTAVIPGLEEMNAATVNTWLVKNVLPEKIRCWGSLGNDGNLQRAGFKWDSSIKDNGCNLFWNTSDPNNPVVAVTTPSSKSWGYVKVEWGGFPDVYEDGKDYLLTAYIPAGTEQDSGGNTYQIVVNSNDPRDYQGGETHKDTSAIPDMLQLKVTVKGIDLSPHTVTPASPDNVTVNLFDYWVNEAYGENPASTQGDILQKSDQHKGSSSAPSTTFWSTVADWNQGINKGHLLLFGDGLIHAGLWNKGAGESCDYGKEYAGMEGIVKSVLGDNGYPEMNLVMADKILTGAAEGSDMYRDYIKIGQYMLAGEHVDSTDYDGTEIQNLSKTLIGIWQSSTGKKIDTDTESLDYLFDPETPNNYKKTYENVTGLFQLDNDGYYYYNMRENFAEFREGTQTDKNGQPSDGRFILYDAPATTRTDAKKSIGNFFPFNKGSEVFTGMKEDGSLSSSVACSGNTMNHHLGMTVEVDFRQPLNGQINAGSHPKPMTFEFSGDDDVWVFIDDVLVLDIGGTHSELYGTIDFHTGDVYIGRGFDTKGIPEDPADSANMVTHTTLRALFANAQGDDFQDSNWNENTFASNTVHSLKMFYLERGNYDSSIALRFNLQPMLPQRIVKVDQNGQPLPGVKFTLHPARELDESETVKTGDIACLYTDGVKESKPFYVRPARDEELITLTTDADGTAMFRYPDGSFFNFADRGNAYYILEEVEAPRGYRKQPVDIVLYYDQKTAMLSVANRWSTGAYACSVSNIAAFGDLHYGTLNNSGEVETSETPVPRDEQKDGLIVAVPLLKKRSNNGWLALSGGNLTGFASQEIANINSEDDWKVAVLTAALEQAKGEGNAPWHLEWNPDNNRLEGILYDLPGLASRYRLLNPESGDMHMVYGIISADALKKANGTAVGTVEERYEAFGNSTVEALLSDFDFLSIEQFNRDFRSMIYIPNERRELWVRKVDQDGQPLEDTEFGLYDPSGKLVSSGLTGKDGMLIFSPNPPKEADGKASKGYAEMVWANGNNTRYDLKEIAPPAGHALNTAVTPVIVGIYSIYADAGDKDNGVSVLAGAGRLTQTMRQYAMDNNVDITLQDITAFMQTQESGQFKLDGWLDAKLEGTELVRSMNLHFGKNTEVNDGLSVDYGLHDEDGGQYYRPFFATDTGFIRTRIRQNWNALTGGQYEGTQQDVNKDYLRETDLTNLFSLLNIVVVTDQNPDKTPDTGKLTISKKLVGSGYEEAEYTKLFQFKVDFTDADGSPLPDSDTFDYYFYGKDKTGSLKSGATVLLHHDEAITILGLPVGTKYTVTEIPADNWHVTPEGGEYTGSIDEKDKTYVAAFTNSTTPRPKGSLTISKTVSGESLTEEDQKAEFTFTLLLQDREGQALAGSYPYTGSKSGRIGNGGIITLSHGQSITVTGLPEGTQYRVTEARADGWEDVRDQAGVIVQDTEKAAAFVNTKTTPDKPVDPDGPDPDPDPKDPEEPKEPEKPEKPEDPENPPEEPKDPESPETPSTPEEPERPVNPGYPTELPDPNDPDSPDEVTIWEDDVPRTYLKIWDPEEEEYFYIPEDEIPLAPPVQTGKAALWLLSGICAGLGLAAAGLLRKRKSNGK